MDGYPFIAKDGSFTFLAQVFFSASTGPISVTDRKFDFHPSQQEGTANSRGAGNQHVDMRMPMK